MKCDLDHGLCVCSYGTLTDACRLDGRRSFVSGGGSLHRRLRRRRHGGQVAADRALDAASRGRQVTRGQVKGFLHMFDRLRLSSRRLATLSLLAASVVVPATVTTAGSAAAAYDACGVVSAKPTGGTWTCTFVDNFDGRRLDTSKWVVGNSASSGFTIGSTCYVSGTGVNVSWGTLQLTVTKKAPFLCKTPAGALTATFTGGGVSTWGKFAQTYGRFEARMKFPGRQTAGLHSNFWMNPKQLAYGAWPASGEIDVAEWFSRVADRLYPSLHYTGRTTADTGWNCVVGAQDVYHTYAVEWSATKMDFIYDGQLCFSRSWAPTGLAAPAPFDQPFTVALVAGANAGFETGRVSTTYVDYVKAWS